MAGKTKREGGQSPQSARTAKTAEPSKPLGHLGVKSSPFAPTDCKLVSQYIVRDRMTAHYKKLNKARAAVDTGPPKAWLVSQKMRDQARREAIKADEKREKFPQKTRPHSARRYSESDTDREELMAMMNSNLYDDGVDQPMVHSARHAKASMDVHQSELEPQPFVKHTVSDMRLVNSIIDDSVLSPSKYSSHKTYKSNIPASATLSKKPTVHRKMKTQQPLYKTQVLSSYSPMPYDPMVMVYGNPALTPRSADLIDLHKERFTEEKKFQPRTLKTNRESKLSQFKYYNPPKRKPKEADHSPVRPDSAMSGKGNLRSSMRPGTANTMESTDWMNDTLMSRDYSDHTSPCGVPRLDITLDKDHLSWLKDQSQKASVRSTSARTEEPGSGRRGDDLIETGGHGATFTLNGSVRTMGDEELQYLEFVKDVTNDILDRGIFTNRVLKQVFETHVIRRRHQLKEEKMREMLEDLRIDLGIPSSDDDDPEGVGLTSTFSNSRKNRRSQQDYASPAGKSPGRKTLPNLHMRSPAPVNRGRSPSPEGKPPIHKGNSKAGSSRAYLDSTMSSLGASQEYGTSREGDSVFGTVTNTQVSSTDHHVQEENHLEDTLNEDVVQTDRVNGNMENSALLYQRQLQASLDRDDSEGSDLVSARPLSTQRSDDGQYTDRTGGQQSEEDPDQYYTDRTEQSSHRSFREGVYSPEVADTHRSGGEAGFNTERTDQLNGSRTDDDEYTSVTDDNGEDHYTERTLTETARSSQPRPMDDCEIEITPRKRRGHKSPKTPRYSGAGRGTGEAGHTTRSHDSASVTESDTIEVSDIDNY